MPPERKPEEYAFLGELKPGQYVDLDIGVRVICERVTRGRTLLRIAGKVPQAAPRIQASRGSDKLSTSG